MAIDQAALAGPWLHSHEEDSTSETVYRPKDYALPPARGRKGLELKASGQYTEQGFGPTDRRVESGRGSWKLQGHELVLTDAAGHERRKQVLEASPQRLVLAKV
jgi:hypothetical protein